MEQLTWTGGIGSVLDPIFLVAVSMLVLSLAAQIVLAYAAPSGRASVNADGTIALDMSLYGRVSRVTGWALLAVVGVILLYIVSGAMLGASGAGIVGGIAQRLLPVWIALALLFAVSLTWKRRMGLYGKLFDSTVGMIGFGLVMFWVFTGLFGAMDWIVTHETLSQIAPMKNAPPGSPLPDAAEGQYPWYLLGGDNLARDIFSRIVDGALIVVQIAPLATLFAFMVGITLGLPAGYYGGTLDVVLSFLANLILAFPVILLFYLLVTPEITAVGVPNYMATVLFLFPLIFVYRVNGVLHEIGLIA